MVHLSFLLKHEVKYFNYNLYTYFTSALVLTVLHTNATRKLKGIVHFEINFWDVLAYLKGIQDVGVFVSTVV